jgi:hypothetical protein
VHESDHVLCFQAPGPTAHHRPDAAGVGRDLCQHSWHDLGKIGALIYDEERQRERDAPRLRLGNIELVDILGPDEGRDVGGSNGVRTLQ